MGIRALGAAKGAPGKAGRPCCRLRTRRRCREAGPGACVQLATLSRTPGLQKPTNLYVIPAVPPTSSCPQMPPASLFLSHPAPGPPAKVFKMVFKNPEFTSVISHRNYYRRSPVSLPAVAASAPPSAARVTLPGRDHHAPPQFNGARWLLPWQRGSPWDPEGLLPGPAQHPSHSLHCSAFLELQAFSPAASSARDVLPDTHRYPSLAPSHRCHDQ